MAAVSSLPVRFPVSLKVEGSSTKGHKAASATTGKVASLNTFSQRNHIGTRLTEVRVTRLFNEAVDSRDGAALVTLGKRCEAAGYVNSAMDCYTQAAAWGSVRAKAILAALEVEEQQFAACKIGKSTK